MGVNKITLSRVRSIRSHNRSSQISSVKNKTTMPNSTSVITRRSELDSHADTMVAGKNCIIMHYTDRTCTVSPYDDQEYKPVTDVPIVQAATGFTSSNGRNYILIINEALSMPSLDHSLWNPNQMRGHGVEVNDNPYGDEPMSISSSDENMVACLQHDGTTIFLNTWTPTETDLLLYPHIILTSPHPWDPQNVRFPETPYSVKEEMEKHNVSQLEVNSKLDVQCQVTRICHGYGHSCFFCWLRCCAWHWVSQSERPAHYGTRPQAKGLPRRATSTGRNPPAAGTRNHQWSGPPQVPPWRGGNGRVTSSYHFLGWLNPLFRGRRGLPPSRPKRSRTTLGEGATRPSTMPMVRHGPHRGGGLVNGHGLGWSGGMGCVAGKVGAWVGWVEVVGRQVGGWFGAG